jgi:hypothetical protein
MRQVLALAMLTACTVSATTMAQSAPYSPQPGSAERKAIMDAVRTPFEKKLGKKVIFQVSHLKVQNGWAFMHGTPRQPGGKEMDYRGTPYQRCREKGQCDDWIVALLRRKGEAWVVVTYEFGCTDVCYYDWKEKYTAPPGIFE